MSTAGAINGLRSAIPDQSPIDGSGGLKGQDGEDRHGRCHVDGQDDHGGPRPDGLEELSDQPRQQHAPCAGAHEEPAGDLTGDPHTPLGQRQGGGEDRGHGEAHAAGPDEGHPQRMRAEQQDSETRQASDAIGEQDGARRKANRKGDRQ